MESDVQKELEELDYNTESYWREMDKLDDNVNWKELTESKKNEYAKQLLGELGKDIQNVTSGKIKVKVPLKRKLKWRLEQFFKRFV